MPNEPIPGGDAASATPDAGLRAPGADTTLSDLPAIAAPLLAEDGPNVSEEDEEWPTRRIAPGVRLRVPTLVLLALLIAAGAFWGGAAAQRSQGTAGGGSGLGRRLAAADLARRALGGGAGPTASGIVTVIEGRTLYLTGANGAIVKVVLGASTTIARDAGVTQSALRPGDTVVVEGTKASDGTVTAASVSATAAGVSPAGGGFGSARAALGGG